MKNLLLVLFFLSFVAPAIAGSASDLQPGTFKSVDSSVDNDSFNAVNESENTQRNQGTVNQTSIMNVGEAAKYRFGEFGVSCASPVGILSAGRVRYDNEYTDQITGALVFPFGGSNGRNCKRAAEAIADEHVMDTEIKTAKACAELNANNVTLAEEKFPYLADMCGGVTLTPPSVQVQEQEIQLRQTVPPPPVQPEYPPIERRTRG